MAIVCYGSLISSFYLRQLYEYSRHHGLTSRASIKPSTRCTGRKSKISGVLKSPTQPGESRYDSTFQQDCVDPPRTTPLTLPARCCIALTIDTGRRRPGCGRRCSTSLLLSSDRTDRQTDAKPLRRRSPLKEAASIIEARALLEQRYRSTR